MIGRTSIEPHLADGIWLASSMASSRSTHVYTAHAPFVISKPQVYPATP